MSNLKDVLSLIGLNPEMTTVQKTLLPFGRDIVSQKMFSLQNSTDPWIVSEYSENSEFSRWLGGKGGTWTPNSGT